MAWLYKLRTEGTLRRLFEDIPRISWYVLPSMFHCFCDSDFELGRDRLHITNGAARDAKVFEQAKTVLVAAGRGDLLV